MAIKAVGTHNLLDGKGMAIAFAQVLLWTEVTKKIYQDRVARRHKIFRTRFQRDLAISIDAALAERMTHVVKHYRLVHIGVIKVTPHRGIFWITCLLDGRLVAFMVEHRINAWYPPWIRGERWLRSRWWHKHTRMSNEIQQRLIDKGYEIYAGGDPNAPEGVLAYPLLHETEDAHLDRVASTRLIRSWRAMAKGGSDHRRLLAWLK